MTEKTLSQLITRTPRIPDGTGSDVALDEFAADLRPLLGAAAALAPYLAGLLAKEGAWLNEAVEAPQAALAAEIARTGSLAPEALAAGLRQGKRRVALLSAVADLGGAWSLEQVTGALTDYADAACAAALQSAIAALIRRGKLPGLSEDDIETAGGMTVLAMGKMGAGELNYSSDIDLICLFDENRYDISDFQEARAGLIKATRQMSATLSEITGEGYVFRTDLRLRPDPAVTPVCMGIEAAERYYESLGRTWERAAYIKARPAAGDRSVGEAFLETLRPFVWRRHLDFAAIQDAHDMRLAIRSHKGLGGPITLPGHNMKLGRGGIREIEFFTQTRQLIAGGRDPELRVRPTKQALATLARKGWVPQADADVLSDHYTFHRTVEHRLQMVQDAQTHSLPPTDEGFARIAAMMDMDVADFRRTLTDRLSAVHQLTEGFFTAGPLTRPAPAIPDHAFDTTILDRWPGYPALRSTRASEIFERLKPELLSRLARSDRPDEALLAFDRFLAGLPAGVQLFSLLRSNPQLADLLIRIVTVSPMLAEYLSRNAQVLDAVIGGDFFSDWPEEAVLVAALRERLEALDDYESQLDTARGWSREWHFRIGVHLLQGLIDAAEAGRQYADLARAVLVALKPVVEEEFARRHGPPPGEGAVILGMGSLGAARLTAQSDLDMIVIYDPRDVETSDGRRPLAARLYYARLTQALITALSAPMAQGRLYEVDLRLRPSGNQGPVATSLAAFDSYQRTQAWVWEHLALSRARVVAGPAPLSGRVEELRTDILSATRDRDAILRETAEMRGRIAAAKAPEGLLDAKIGAGRLQDIELFAQAGALLGAYSDCDVAGGITAAARAGLIGTRDAQTLIGAYEAIWALQAASRLISAQPLQADTLGDATQAFLLRVMNKACETDIGSDLETYMGALYADAERIISAGLKGAEVS
ncbi:glutamine-synthetase adenylyltransferase [Sulfitobacter sp. HNIBRBA3233]|uniref:[protein-PII] uridylyltransferase family protein n=1 Tax=Sulfitobacter marinivivus TaxID=3158558 RepID=UPI0032DECAA7